MRKAVLFLSVLFSFAIIAIAGCATVSNGFPSGEGGSDFSSTPKPAVEIYCTVTYSNGAESFEKRVKYGDYADDIEPENTDTHEFLYWSRNGEKYDFDTPVTEDIELKASWEAKIFSVIFMHMGKVITTCEYSGDDTEIAVPDFKTDFGYRVRFRGELSPSGSDLIIEVDYVPVPLKTFYYVDGNIFRIEERTVEELSCDLPQGYDWQPPEFCTAGTDEYVIIRGVKTIPSEEPIDPVDPVEPIDPVDPVEPVNPVDPVEPTEPTPPKPEDPEPVEPVVPEEPVEPDEPDGTEAGKFSEWNVEFDKELNGYVILGYLGNESEITVPSRMEDGKNVLKIGRNAFENGGLTLVTISEGITVIGNSAFRSCGKLASVTLPSTLKEIGLEAFCFTTINEIDIPQGVTKIGSNAFYRCVFLQKITLPKLSELSDYAFAGCISLEELDISDVETLGVGAFMSCVKLKRVNLGSGVKTVGENAFKDCTSLAEVTFGVDVMRLGSCAFEGCRSLIKATFLNPEGWKVYDISLQTYNDLSAYIKNSEAMAGIISLSFAKHEFFRSPY